MKKDKIFCQNRKVAQANLLPLVPGSTFSQTYLHEDELMIDVALVPVWTMVLSYAGYLFVEKPQIKSVLKTSLDVTGVPSHDHCSYSSAVYVF